MTWSIENINTNLPLELGRTIVEVNGKPAQLFYVSPAQINFVVPANAQSGDNAVSVSLGGFTSPAGPLVAVQ